MIFRYARHTTDLNRIEKFYTEIVGLEKIGSFENHDNYNGLFLGHRNADWHLEFTNSPKKPNHHFDDDDILVFYVNSKIELLNINEYLRQKKIDTEEPENPYWSENGIMISDPDNHKVIFAIKHLSFISDDKLTTLVQSKGIKSWSDLLEYIWKLPYGRNSNRADFALVLEENKGTCSSKHALLKKIADLNQFGNVKLILGIYKMNESNTPKISSLISDENLEYIPEAHCYLKLNNKRIDITNIDSNINSLRNDIIEELEIEAEQVVNFKVEYHKKFIRKWIEQKNINMSFHEIWTIREACIKRLEE